jgi:hypothetical protein
MENILYNIWFTLYKLLPCISRFCEKFHIDYIYIAKLHNYCIDKLEGYNGL